MPLGDNQAMTRRNGISIAYHQGKGIFADDAGGREGAEGATSGKCSHD